MFCPTCGKPNQDKASSCAACGAPMPGSHTVADELGLLIPVKVNFWAFISGYLGLFSLLIVFGPLALVTGIVGLQQLRRNPGQRGRGRAWFGIIMGTLASLVALWSIVAIAAN
jgi:hypothetical protein